MRIYGKKEGEDPTHIATAETAEGAITKIQWAAGEGFREIALEGDVIAGGKCFADIKARPCPVAGITAFLQYLVESA